jgi:hypothetical protein
MEAIFNGCRAHLTQNRPAACGEYDIDLTQYTFDTRNIQSLAVNQTCFYRAYSTCGYPEVSIELRNQTIVEDFDIIYATQTGLQRDEDIPFELKWASEW